MENDAVESLVRPALIIPALRHPVLCILLITNYYHILPAVSNVLNPPLLIVSPVDYSLPLT